MPEIFGEWVMCLDTFAHYRLKGKFLCKTAYSESGNPIPVHPLNRTPIPGTMCPKCNEMNEARWTNLETSKGK